MRIIVLYGVGTDVKEYDEELARYRKAEKAERQGNRR